MRLLVIGGFYWRLIKMTVLTCIQFHRKRESKTKEARKKKHILSEQRRRNHMNEAIDTLKAYLPGQNVPARYPFL
jgi:hypothetical protein